MRALDMAKYITENTKSKWDDRKRNTETGKLATKLQGCANYLVFKRYLTVDEVRLHAANFCKKHLLAPFCAMRRGAKYLQVYKQRLDVVLQENPKLRAFMVTLTVKDGENLSSGSRICVRLSRSIRSSAGMLSKVKSRSNMQSAAGGVMSIEVKRGRNSGLWHPHVHMIWLCNQAPSASQLSKEWLELTGDSYIVDVREFYGESVVDGFLEVFKYALKFSDMELADNWEAFQTLKAKRLVDNFGLFRGVQVPDDLTDDDIDDEFILLLYRFIKGSGFNFVGQGNTAEIMEILGVSEKRVSVHGDEDAKI